MRNQLLRLTAVFTFLLIATVSGQSSKQNAEPDYPGDDYVEDPDESSDPAASVTQGGEIPPSRIYTEPQVFEVRLNAAVVLPCNVSHPEDVSVMWYRGGTLLYSDNMPFIEGEEKNRIIRRNDNSLIIYGFSESDAAQNYTCSLFGVSIPDSVTHIVRVLRPTTMTTTTTTTTMTPPPSSQSRTTSKTPFAKKLEVYPNDFILVDRTNMDHTLICQANWMPKPNITWSRGEERIKSDPSPEDGSRLTLRNIKFEDSGHYACLAGESKSKAILAFIDVVVPHAPVVEVEQEMVHIGFGTQVELTCNVYGYPQPNVIWHKGSKKLPLMDNVKIISVQETVHTIIIPHVRKEDLANYTCRARNEHGVADHTINLTAVPRTPRMTKGEVADDDDSPVLEWTVESYFPITQYKLKYRRVGEEDWHILNPMVVSSMTNTFTVKQKITGLQPGSYRTILYACNDYGCSPEPKEPYVFEGDYVTEEPDVGKSKASKAGTESFFVLRSLLLVLSLHVCTSYL